jgi:fatty acid-binding protein DegV
MQPDTMYRVLIAHVDNERGAADTRHHILEKHGRIHSCHITEAGPALGVHLGLGGLIVGFMPQPEVLT